MRFARFQTKLPMLLACCVVVASCASKDKTSQQFPSAQDLQTEPKPQLTADALNSAAALEEHDARVEAWGERGWRAVGRVCVWARDMGMPSPPC